MASGPVVGQPSFRFSLATDYFGLTNVSVPHHQNGDDHVSAS